VKQLEKPPVPPLGDGAWARIEKQLFAALDAEADAEVALLRAVRPARRAYRLAFAGAAVLAVVAGVVFMRGPRPGSEASITTGDTASHVAIAGATLDVAPASALSLREERSGTMIVVLQRGRVTCEVAPRRHRAPFVVQAGATRVEVVGTRFSVERMGEHARVQVEHGTVRVVDKDREQLLHAGDAYAPAVAAVTPPSPAPSHVEPTVAPAVTAARPAAAPTAAAGVVPMAEPAPRAPRVRKLAERDGEAAARAVEDAAPAREVPAEPQPVAPVAQAEPQTIAPAGSQPPAPVAPVAPAGSPSGALPPPSSAQDRFEAAARLERTQPERALDLYGEIATGNDVWAADALFAKGRLEAERGQTEPARRSLRDYLARFPRGPNADDVRQIMHSLP
jgi:hypothetical protein